MAVFLTQSPPACLCEARLSRNFLSCLPNKALLCQGFYRRGTEANEQFALTLKSSGADSSVLTRASHKPVAAIVFGHSERHVVVLAA